jgi:hypothetical protein
MPRGSLSGVVWWSCVGSVARVCSCSARTILIFLRSKEEIGRDGKRYIKAQDFRPGR